MIAPHSTARLHNRAYLHSESTQQGPAVGDGSRAGQLLVLVHGAHGVEAVDRVQAVLLEVPHHRPFVGLAEGLRKSAVHAVPEAGLEDEGVLAYM